MKRLVFTFKSLLPDVYNTTTTAVDVGDKLLQYNNIIIIISSLKLEFMR